MRLFKEQQGSSTIFTVIGDLAEMYRTFPFPPDLLYDICENLRKKTIKCNFFSQKDCLIVWYFYLQCIAVYLLQVRTSLLQQST